MADKININANDEQSAVMDIIKKALALPGIKVNRTAFLSDLFKNCDSDTLHKIIVEGPVSAGIGKHNLYGIAKNLIRKRTLQSTGMSFASGIPGGPIGLTAGLSADTVQFFGIAMRLAQELSYLYGNEDIWADNIVDDAEVSNEILMYLGVMFGVSGASAAVRVVSSAFAKTALKKLPKVALTKTIVYPIVKSIAKLMSVRMTKDIFAKGVSKAIPVIGGVISGTITFASMRPMGLRLADEFDKACFSYSETDYESDMKTLNNISEAEYYEVEDNKDTSTNKDSDKQKTIAEQLAEVKEFFDSGVLTQEEFNEIKRKLIEKL